MPYLNSNMDKIKFITTETGGVRATVSATQVSSKVLLQELNRRYPGKYSVQV